MRRAERGSADVSRPSLIAFCGLLLSVSAFSCDITLPAFWSMQGDLGAPIEWVQAVVPVFLIFQAIGQLAFGPVSDRYGRRPVILVGLVLYLAGAAIASLAQGIGVVHVGRAAQGFGSACGIAVGRAVLRDISHGPALQAMAMAMIFAVGPISAPLSATGSWRSAAGRRLPRHERLAAFLLVLAGSVQRPTRRWTLLRCSKHHAIARPHPANRRSATSCRRHGYAVRISFVSSARFTSRRSIEVAVRAAVRVDGLGSYSGSSPTIA
jgi:DHA1 family bicyclomycin/chloramphenicol resistance-like MFS transporter